MDPLTLSLLSMIPNLAAGIGGKVAHDNYADSISGLKLDTPTGLTEAEAMLRKMAGTGLPGVDTIKGNIEGTLPQTIEAMKEVVGNPAMLLGAINDAQGGVVSQLSDISIKDAMTKIQNSSTFANFLSSVKALFQVQQNQYANDVKLGMEKEKLMGWKELFGAISSGTSGAVSTYGNLSSLEAYKGMYSAWGDFMAGQNKSSKTTTDPGQYFNPSTIMTPEMKNNNLTEKILLG